MAKRFLVVGLPVFYFRSTMVGKIQLCLYEFVKPFLVLTQAILLNLSSLSFEQRMSQCGVEWSGRKRRVTDRKQVGCGLRLHAGNSVLSAG